MKVAVITPYYNESMPILNRCIKSVANQTTTSIVHHIIVADTAKRVKRKHFPSGAFQLINLNCNHGDAGATPRALGAISAFSQGFDAVAFLDADNSYEPTHIETMVKICSTEKVDLVSATRNIYSSFEDKFGNKCLYTDTVESNGQDFCDTNCLFMTRALMPLMTHWITSKDLYLAGDRAFWNLIVSNQNIKREHCSIPTVNYFTKWAWHFQYAKEVIPDDSVWMKTDSRGKITIQKHKETKNES
jgi:glycosyltransferase involved in cell wall biosynthesis